MNERSAGYSPEVQLALRQFKAEFFKALSHPTRVHIVELLRDQERSAGDLLEHLGIEQANGSQHLSVLRAKGIVLTRKEGSQVFYRLRDPMIGEVLDTLRNYFQTQLAANVSIFSEMASQGESV